jgi:hypothetical protein
VTFGDATNVPALWNVHMQFGTGSDTLTLAGNGTVATPNYLTGFVDMGGPGGVFDPTGSLAAGTWRIVSPFTLRSSGLATIRFAGGILSISPGSGEVGLGASTLAPLLIIQTAQNTFSVKDGAGALGTFSPVADIHVTGGPGNDFITLDVNGLAYTGSFEAHTGSGSDTVQVKSTGGAGSVRGNLSITSGDGNDSIGLASSVSIKGDLSINLGGGNDSVTEDATVSGDMTWQLGIGNDTVTIGNAPGGLLRWNSGDGNDSVTFGDATNAPGLWNVHMQFGTGNDTLTLAGNGTVATPNKLTGFLDMGGPPGVNSFDPTGSLAAGTWIIVSPFTRQNV